LQIKNILHCVADTNEIQSYSDPLALVQCFIGIVSNKDISKQLSFTSNANQASLSRLISNKRNQITSERESYLSHTFNNECDQIKKATFKLAEFDSFCGRFHITECFNSTRSMIDFNVFCQIFPNLQDIQIMLTNNTAFSTQTIDYLHYNLSSLAIRESESFRTIEFCYESAVIPYSVRSQFTARLQDRFDRIGWAVSMENNASNQESIFFIKINIPSTIPPPPPPPVEYGRNNSFGFFLDQNQANYNTFQSPFLRSMSNSLRESLIPRDDADQPRRRKNTVQRLQLRIIQHPLSYDDHESTTCCLCCRDFVHSMSREERVAKLVCGFVRISGQDASMPIPSEIYQICMNYVGSAKYFTHHQLQTAAEQRQESRRRCQRDCERCCEDCCDDIRRCFRRCGSCCEDYCCDGPFPYIWSGLLAIVLLGLAFGKDIAALVIYGLNDHCTDTLQHSKYIDVQTLGIDEWILYGAVSHSTWYVVLVCYACCLLPSCGCRCCDRLTEDLGSCFGCSIVVAWLFFFAWAVVGFLMHSEMLNETPQDANCRDVVLSWCILQIVEPFVPFISVCCIFLFIDWDDD